MKTQIECILILFLIVAFQSCSKGAKNSSTVNEPDSTTSYDVLTDENILKNKDYSYYESKGYQVFTQANLAINPPCILKDVSLQAQGDFLINYGGVENENNEKTLAAYQLMVSRFPISYSHFSEEKKQSFREEILLETIKELDNNNYKRVKIGHEGYDGIIIESTKNGYSLKGETFIKDDYVIGMVVISNDNLESRFNQYTNSIRFISESIEQENTPNLNEEISENKGYKSYTKNGSGAFSIIYPEAWEVIENPNQYACVAIVEPLNGNNFRSNFNVVTSTTQTIRLEDSFTNESVKQMKAYFPDYELISKDFITLKGNKCMKIVSRCTMEDYPVKQIQFLLKKGTSTSYVISFTIASNRYREEYETIERIINSLNIK